MHSRIEKPKIRMPLLKDKFFETKKELEVNAVNTVCVEAQCLNRFECWQNKTATFLLLGKICTRNCRFCATKTARKGETLDFNEINRIIKLIRYWNIKYVVLTSVDRDDLKDFGASYFAEAVKKIRKKTNAKIECLIPDFNAEKDLLKEIVKAKPDVISHNIETVKELSSIVRDNKASYQKSLKVLRLIKELNSEIKTKSSIMLGFGEKKQQILKTLKDLRKALVDFLVLGQYLQPTPKQLKVKKYYTENEFKELKELALSLGFEFVVSEPKARTSYKAWQQFNFNHKL